MAENYLFEQPLQQLYEDLKDTIRDSISKTGSGWARRRLQTALILQNNLSQLTHWGTDIRNATHKTLDKVERQDEVFATTIRNQLAAANQYVWQLRQLCENRSNNTTTFDMKAEASLAESFQLSIKSLQYQVDPLRELIDSLKQPWAQAVVGQDLSSVSFLTDDAQRLLDNPESDLGELIKVCNSINFEGKRFYSATTLMRIMTVPRITVFLRRECPGLSESAIQGLLKQIMTRFIKVFSILLILRLGGHIPGFVENNISDHVLPLMYYTKENTQGLEDQTNTRLFPLTWSRFQLVHFENIQWEFLSPVLDSRHFYHLRLGSRVPLPWQNATESADTTIHEGHFSSVQKFRIEPSSHNLFDITTATIAVKTWCHPFHNSESNAFWGRNESEALCFIHSLNDPHLIKSYGVIEQEKMMHLIFPYAECTLRQYWSSNSGVLREPGSSDLQSSSSSEIFAAWDELTWLSNQLRGITQGLATLHDPGKGVFMRHGDIKPENIFLIRASNELRGKLVIGDFGISHIHTAENPDSEEQKVEYVTLAYMPPECDIQDGVLSRHSDVWSLGCVILEFMCWALGGNDLTESFAKERVAYDPHSSTIYSFFEVAEDDGGHISRIHPVVVEYFKQLRRLPHCTEFVSDILSIVQDHMLILNSRERVSALGLVRMLNKTHAKVIASKAYAALPIPVQNLPIKEEQPPIQIVPRIRIVNEEKDKKAATEVEMSGGAHSKLSSKPQSRAQEHGRITDRIDLTSLVIASRKTVPLLLGH